LFISVPGHNIPGKKNNLYLYYDGVTMKLIHCNEKGMRFESATVPAAVIPDPALGGMMVL